MPNRTSLLICTLLMAMTAAAAAAESVQTEMAKRGNVRYGPSTDAEIIVTLSVGSDVEVIGQVLAELTVCDGFPRQGHA